MTLYLHGRWGDVWEARVLEVASVIDAERELAHMAREWDQLDAVLMDHGQRVAEWGPR